MQKKGAGSECARARACANARVICACFKEMQERFRVLGKKHAKISVTTASEQDTAQIDQLHFNHTRFKRFTLAIAAVYDYSEKKTIYSHSVSQLEL